MTQTINIIHKINTELEKRNIQPNSAEAMRWLHQFITKNVKTFNPRQQFALGERTVNPKPGFVYAYNYDPKYKDTLPYYDSFPLIMCLDVTKDGWTGINLHYIPPKVRSVLFGEMLEHLNNDKFNEQTKFKLTWGKLKLFAKHKFFKHAVKRYLTQQLGTPLFKIPAHQWGILVMLPTARFQKATAQQVWKDI